MDEIVKKISSLGFPCVILVIMVAASGEMDRTFVLTKMLPTSEGTFVLVNSLNVLSLITIIGETPVEYGIEAVLSNIYSERSKNEPRTVEIIEE